MLRNTLCVSKRCSRGGENKSDPPARHGVGTVRVPRHPPGLRTASPLCLSKGPSLLRWKRVLVRTRVSLFQREYDCVFEGCSNGWSATDPLYWFEQQMNLCLKSKSDKTSSSVTQPWGTEDLKPCKNQSLISVRILVGIWSECIPMLVFAVLYFKASFRRSRRGFFYPLCISVTK